MVHSKNRLVCFNGGVKVIHDDIPVCQCLDGFTGRHCQSRFFDLGFSASTPVAFIALIALTVLLIGTVSAFVASKKSTIRRSQRELATQKVMSLSSKENAEIFV